METVLLRCWFKIFHIFSPRELGVLLSVSRFLYKLIENILNNEEYRKLYQLPLSGDILSYFQLNSRLKNSPVRKQILSIPFDPKKDFPFTSPYYDSIIIVRGKEVSLYVGQERILVDKITTGNKFNFSCSNHYLFITVKSDFKANSPNSTIGVNTFVYCVPFNHEEKKNWKRIYIPHDLHTIFKLVTRGEWIIFSYIHLDKKVSKMIFERIDTFVDSNIFIDSTPHLHSPFWKGNHFIYRKNFNSSGQHLRIFTGHHMKSVFLSGVDHYSSIPLCNNPNQNYPSVKNILGETEKYIIFHNGSKYSKILKREMKFPALDKESNALGYLIIDYHRNEFYEIPKNYDSLTLPLKSGIVQFSQNNILLVTPNLQ